MDYGFGHGDEVMVWDRPVVTPWVVGKAIQATLNTGCSQTLLRAGLIPEDNIEWHRLVRMRCIHGREEQYQRGYVDMKVAKRTGKMRVGFTLELDGEMIIGRDWTPLYDVLEEVKQAELERKGWPWV